MLLAENYNDIKTCLLNEYSFKCQISTGISKVTPCGKYVYFLIMETKGKHAEVSTVFNKVEYFIYF